MSITSDQLQQLSGRGDVYAGSEKVGGIGQIYLDDSTGEPSWVTVKTGLFGTSQSFVPLRDAEVRNDDVVVAYDKDQIKGAPRVDDDGSISPEEEDRLYDYYGLSAVNTTTDTTTGMASDVSTGMTSGTTTGESDTSSAAYGGVDDPRSGYAVAGRDAEPDQGPDSGLSTADGSDAAYDTSGPTTDEAMTRSEERVNVGTQTREAGRARLRKYVTTETVSQTVPLRHEEVTLEREPITDANGEAANDGPSISEEEHEVVLHEEVPVVEKEAVPVERVRLGTETKTEETTVSTEARQEHVELEDDGTTEVRDNDTARSSDDERR